MSNQKQKLSLSDMGVKPDPRQGVGLTPTSVPKIVTPNMTSGGKIEKVSISDIATTAPKPDIRKEAEQEYMDMIDQGIERRKAEALPRIAKVKEEIAAELMDREAAGAKSTVSTPATAVAFGASVEPETVLHFSNEEVEEEKMLPTPAPILEPIPAEAPTMQAQAPAETKLGKDLDELDENISAAADSDVFNSIDDADLRELEDDVKDEDDEEELQKEKDTFEAFKAQIKDEIKVSTNILDLSKFKVKSRPISINKVLASKATTPTASDWLLYNSKRAISMTGLKGDEIVALNVNDRDLANRFTAYHNAYATIYEHLVDGNKPAGLEAWLKSTPFFDLDHLYFLIYKACFENSNFVPYNCPHCKNIFMEKKAISDMIKYASDEVKEKCKAILQKETSSPTAIEADLVQVSDEYAIAFKTPSIYNIVFEPLALEQDFIRKYATIISVLGYIDKIYFLDVANAEMTPIDPLAVPDNFAKTIRRKVLTYYKVIKTLSSDQYSVLTSNMRKINDKASDDVTYIIPATTCPKCKKIIEESQRRPLDMLFTRHQLLTIAAISTK